MIELDTESDLLQLGRQLLPRVAGWYVLDEAGWRPLGVFEMTALSAVRKAEIQQLIDRDGCCGGPISDYGRCPRTGHICPLYRDAKRIEQKTFSHSHEDQD